MLVQQLAGFAQSHVGCTLEWGLPLTWHFLCGRGPLSVSPGSHEASSVISHVKSSFLCPFIPALMPVWGIVVCTRGGSCTGAHSSGLCLPPHVFSFPQERLITDLFMMSVWWRGEPSNMACIYQVQSHCIKTTSFQAFHLPPHRRSSCCSMSCLSVVAGPGQAGAVQNRKEAATLPFLRRTLDFDLYFVS